MELKLSVCVYAFQPRTLENKSFLNLKYHNDNIERFVEITWYLSWLILFWICDSTGQTVNKQPANLFSFNFKKRNELIRTQFASNAYQCAR